MSKNITEVEVKISLSDKDMESLFRYFHEKAGKPTVKHKYMPRYYHDTENLDLYSRDISLRVQYKKGKKGQLGSYEQTVKFETSQQNQTPKGALSRKECKDSLSTHDPDLDAIQDAETKDKLKDFENKDLRFIFTAAVERRFFNLEVGKGKDKAVVELAFDVGAVTLRDNTAPPLNFCELEIEIKKGDMAVIETLCKEVFARADSAKIQPLSKSALGTQHYKKYARPGK